MDLRLDGDTAVVTASSSGLGFASAASLAADGANVVICGRTPERLDEAEAALADEPGEVLAIEADVTDRGDVAALVEATVDEFGGLDHVVTSAGGVPPGTFDDATDEQWRGAFDTLVMSAVWTLREARPHLTDSDAGTVTCITSTSVREAIDGLVLSNAVRRAVIGLVKTVSREWAPDVRANAVLPGAHETARIEELVEDAMDRGEYDSYEEGLADWASDIPLARIGDPSELGDAVAFLASERASFVNGAALPVDGGRLRS
ncbi:SDR family oxidoreductase [Halobaculum halobium]|uniref:SDR family oxidoreductase n=1 Tax=Halobaculum halobium TaxID=3032281 RepID=A0ABD5TG70_9EURY|nr:SDR family oxidoreductase [Halobaculum sp. SYNS20]